jgi:IS4 transposase
MDRAYIDFERLYVFTLSAAFFVVRTKENVLLQRRYSHPVDKDTGVRSDHTVILTTIGSATAYPDALRRISYYDVETNHRLKFLTNNFTLPALTIAQIYKCRWQVELFFKWIKQHLRIKAFYGTSENAVKTPNLDCGLSLRSRCHRPEAPGTGGQPLPNSADIERDAF